MGGVVGVEFADVLRRNRDALNARFSQARRANRALDGAAFTEYLRVCVEPTVAAFVRSGGSEFDADQLVTALYDVALELVGGDLAGPGARYPVLSRMWAELLPAAVLHFEGHPRDAVAALSNAVVNLSMEPGISAQAWLDAMLDLAPAESLEQLLAFGQVVAWRQGMAHFRLSALRVLDGLSNDVVTELLGAHVPAERWPLGDEPSLQAVAHVGDFLGLGGVFDSPPEVLQADGHLFAYDNQGCWTIHADRYGATLKRYGRSLPEGDVRPAQFTVQDGEVRCATSAARYVTPFAPRSWACTDDMAVLTARHSHRITIVALCSS